MPIDSDGNWYVNLNLNVRGLSPSATLAINEQCKALKQQGREVFMLGLGQSPFPVPEQVVEALRQHAHEKDYLPVKGLPALREAIAGYYQRKGISCRQDDVLIGPGSKELLFILQLVYYGDLVIPCPTWVSYSPQAQIIGRMVRWANTKPQNGWRLTAEELDMICRDDPQRPRIVILNYPANPTGTTYSDAQLRELAEVARKYGVVMLSDEIYGELHFKAQHISIAKYYPEGTIISSGLSKWSGAGGWRLGSFVFPKGLRWLLDAMAIVASETFTATSAPIQYAAVTAFEGSPEIQEYLRNSRRVLHAIAKCLVDRARAMHLNLPSPEGAFYLFPDFSFYRTQLREKGIRTSVELCRAVLNDTGVAMLPGSDFGRAPGELNARIAFVDFDGKSALKAAAEQYADLEMGEAFFEQYCPNLKNAFEHLESWLMNQ